MLTVPTQQADPDDEITASFDVSTAKGKQDCLDSFKALSERAPQKPLSKCTEKS
jgi:hypothetical protein